MNTSRILSSSVRPIAAARPALTSRLPLAARMTANRQIRGVQTNGDELGGVQGSEPPTNQTNPVNRNAAIVTVVGVLAAGYYMFFTDAPKKPSDLEKSPSSRAA